MNIFILGLTGGVGRRIATLLIDKGHSVAGLYRRPGQHAQFEEIGATAFAGDIATITSHDLAHVIRGADAIVFTAGAGDQDDEAMIDQVDYGGVIKTVAAMRLTNRGRLLLISVFPEAAREQCPGPSFEHYISAKKKADVAVANSGLEWIILRPSTLTDSPGTGRVSLGLANFHTNITRDDVAATAVALLEAKSMTRKILELTEGDQTVASAVEALATTHE